MQKFIEALDNVRFDNEVQRLFHGRGGRFEGCEHLCLDWFPPVLLLTSFQPLAEQELAEAKRAINAAWPKWTVESSEVKKGLNEPNLVYQYRSGGQTETKVLSGDVPEKHVVKEHGLKYNVHLLRGQNHGLFLDMRNGREWVKEHASGKSVLNLFAYTCGFSVAALAGEATHVVNIDMSKGALAIGKQNHLSNDMPSGARFFGHDIFKSWGKLNKLGPYDLIIADPPSNQKGSFVATKDYVRLLRRIPDLLTPQGEVLLCLNAPQLTSGFLKEQVKEAAPNLEFIERIQNPSVFMDVDDEKALKVLRYRLR